jgi:hypothetical protein
MIVCLAAMVWALPGIADEAGPASVNDANGVWQVVAQIHDGRPLAEGDLRGIQLTLAAGKFVVRRGETVMHEGTGQLVAVQDGMRKSTLHFTQGAFANQTLKQIAVLEQETMISCIAPAGQDWPTDFASTASNGCLLTVYKRCQP